MLWLGDVRIPVTTMMTMPTPIRLRLEKWSIISNIGSSTNDVTYLEVKDGVTTILFRGLVTALLWTIVKTI